MNHVLLVVLSLSLSGSILALILFALNPLIKRQLSQTWQYYIWLVVILRFLLPFSPENSLVGQAARHIESSVPTPILTAEPGNGLPDQPVLQAPADSQAPAQFDEATAPLPQAAATDRWRELQNNIWMVWAAGALMLLAYKIISYNGFLRYVRGRAQKVTDDRLLKIYREELAAAKLRKLPLRVSDRVGSPMLIGLFRPALVIPILEAGDNEIRHIFRHELTHYKRLDYCYKWLVQITKCLHWFNPLMYRISKQIDKFCELSCDEANIRRLDEVGRESYGNALMASLTSQENYSSFVISMTMSENVKQVKERLDAIMGYKKKSRFVICSTIALTILLLCGFTYTGAYGVGSREQGVIISTENSIVTAQEYAVRYGVPVSSVNSIAKGFSENLQTVGPIWPGTQTRRDVSDNLYFEVRTQTKKEPSGRYVWSEILIMNGKDDDAQILLKLRTPDIFITNGAVSLPSNQATGSVDGWGWSGTYTSEEWSEPYHSELQGNGIINYVKIEFSSQLSLDGDTQTISPVCYMVSNAPEGNTYRVGLIHAVWVIDGTGVDIEIPMPPQDNFTSNSEITEQSQKQVATDYSSFDFDIFDRLSSMPIEEVDALAISYIDSTKDIRHVYDMIPYMSSTGIDTSVMHYLDIGGDIGNVGAMLMNMSREAARTVAQRYYDEKTNNDWDWVFEPYL